MSFCSDNSKAAGFRVCRFSFCTNCDIIFIDNSTNELLVWSGLKISVSTSAQLTKFSLLHAYSQPSPLMPDRKPLVNIDYPEGRVYCVTLQEKGELGAEATVRFITYEEARTFFNRASLHCKTIREALA